MSAEPGLGLDTQARDVMAALTRIVRSASFGAREASRGAGLGASHLLVLQLLEARGDRKAGEIAKELLLSKSTTTAILDALEGRGLVSRTRHDSDGRSIVVSITKAGILALATAPASFQTQFLDRFRALPDWERALILSALLRVSDMLVTTSSLTGQL
jgi:DNA-binding MarR family transcriptional regulator